MRVETKWAVIATLAFVVIIFIEKMLGLHLEENHGTWFIFSTIANLVVFIIAYYITCREKREHDHGGIMNWRQGFWACAMMTLVYIPISTAVVLAFVKWGSPDFCAYLAQTYGGADYEKTTMNWWLYWHVSLVMLGGLFFSLLSPLFTRRSVSTT